MLYSPAFSFSSGYPLGVLPCAGLRLGVLRQFQAFLASSACAACASSYHFSSIASPPWRSAFSRFAPVVNLGFPVLASGSNCAVKPTRLRRAAYFRSLVPSYSALCRPAFTPAVRQSQRFLLWGFAVCRASPLGGVPVSSLFGLQPLCSKRYQLSFCKHCAASVAPCFFAVCARRQAGVSRAGFWV